MYNVDVMSWIQSCDVIKSGCDVIYNLYDVIHIVGLISHIFSMCYNQYTLRNRSATVDVMRGILREMI